MKLEYALTLADYKAALRLYRMQSRKALIGFRIWFFIWLFILVPGALFAAFMLVFSIYRLFAQRANLSFIQSIHFGLIVLILLAFIFASFVPIVDVRRQFSRAFPLSARNCTIVLNDDHVTYTNYGAWKDGQYRWNEFESFAQDNIDHDFVFRPFTR